MTLGSAVEPLDLLDERRALQVEQARSVALVTRRPLQRSFGRGFGQFDAELRAVVLQLLRQALALGGNVRNGERGTSVVYADRFVPDDEKRRARAGASGD